MALAAAQLRDVPGRRPGSARRRQCGPDRRRGGRVRDRRPAPGGLGDLGAARPAAVCGDRRDLRRGSHAGVRAAAVCRPRLPPGQRQSQPFAAGLLVPAAAGPVGESARNGLHWRGSGRPPGFDARLGAPWVAPELGARLVAAPDSPARRPRDPAGHPLWAVDRVLLPGHDPGRRAAPHGHGVAADHLRSGPGHDDAAVGRCPGRTTLWERLGLLLLAAASIEVMRDALFFALLALLILPVALPLDRGHRPNARRARLNLGLGGLALCTVLVLGAATLARPDSSVEMVYQRKGILQVVERQTTADPQLKVFADVRFADWLLWRDRGLRGRIANDARFELLSTAQMTRIRNALAALGSNWKQ